MDNNFFKFDKEFPELFFFYSFSSTFLSYSLVFLKSFQFSHEPNTTASMCVYSSFEYLVFHICIYMSVCVYLYILHTYIHTHTHK